jgi:hypothetical protein
VNPNVTYTLDSAFQHVAYIVAQCGKKGIKNVEPKVEAEAEWRDGIVNESGMLIGYLSSCPPGYFNLEGKPFADGRRSATFAGGHLLGRRCWRRGEWKGGWKGCRWHMKITYKMKRVLLVVQPEDMKLLIFRMSPFRLNRFYVIYTQPPPPPRAPESFKQRIDILPKTIAKRWKGEPMFSYTKCNRNFIFCK